MLRYTAFVASSLRAHLFDILGVRQHAARVMQRNSDLNEHCRLTVLREDAQHRAERPQLERHAREGVV